ncbi:hypothetical protein CASFOL_023442 [Castilleja foliolosa]|uniref:Uncharacterized protein n=1 Tax=Castilleja foliolosa TaxID=1961234 RepID=A0ABD3CKK2_9LAMI
MMAISGSLQLSLDLGICNKQSRSSRTRGTLRLLGTNLSSSSLRQCSWSTNLSKRIQKRACTIVSRNHNIICNCILNKGPSLDITCIKNATINLTRSINRFQGSPLVIKLASSIGIVIFAIWGLGPLVRQSRNIFLHESDNSWKKSTTYHVMTSYVQPLLMWVGAIFICRALDPIILPSQSGEIVKQRLLNFIRSLSTVLAFAHCLSREGLKPFWITLCSAVQQLQKFFMETNDPIDNSNMGFQFAGRAVYTAVWVAAVSLFMELLGFSTQKWVTAGGLGTVLLTLTGREILTNFLSSVMIHATRPFVLNEWIQTKIGGYEVSGTVEHVGWWSPTIIRGDDREAVHIPNHKFTVNIYIVADMRKVLAKNPQVEQQKLHRRIFLDFINPENQALSIMVSCFVKTSRFEEYLCVKEAIILDLLRVIAHHRARLATPIRTVQKVYTDAADFDSVPFSDSEFTRGATSNRSLLLIEPSYKINGEDKTKTQSARANGDEDSKSTPRPTQSTPDSKTDVKSETTSDDKAGEVGQKSKGDARNPISLSDPKIDNNNTTKLGDSSTSQQKQDVRSQTISNKPHLEENIVLGVALDGSKRVLPIEEEYMMSPSNSDDTKELAALRSGNGTTKVTEKGNSDTKRSNVTGSTSGDQLDKQE